MNWKPAPAIARLKADATAAYPAAERGSAYVGIIGDARHSASRSDHNPNSRGYVCAVDVGFSSECLDDEFVQALIASRDRRIAYIISDGKMWRSYPKPGIPAWTPAPYRGVNPHRGHVHVSVHQDPALYMDERPWQVKATVRPAAAVKAAAPPARTPGGLTSAQVRALQAGLKVRFPRYAGRLAVDGVWGQRTAAAVEEFQRRSGLKPDGIAGSATRAALAQVGVRL